MKLPNVKLEKKSNDIRIAEQNNGEKIPKTVARIWRILMKNNNIPMTTRELAEKLDVTPNAIVQAIKRYPQYFTIKSRKPLLIELPISKEAVAFREKSKCLICKKIEMNPSEGEIFPLSGKQDSHNFNDWQFICSDCTNNLKRMKFSEYLKTFPPKHREALLKEMDDRKVKGGIQQFIQGVQLINKKIRGEHLEKVILYRQVIVRKLVSVDDQLNLRVYHEVERLHDVKWLRNFLLAHERNEIFWENELTSEKEELLGFIKRVDYQKFLAIRSNGIADVLDVISNDLNWKIIQVQAITSTRYSITCAMEIKSSLYDLILGVMPYHGRDWTASDQDEKNSLENSLVTSDHESSDPWTSLDQVFSDSRLKNNF